MACKSPNWGRKWNFGCGEGESRPSWKEVEIGVQKSFTSWEIDYAKLSFCKSSRDGDMVVWETWWWEGVEIDWLFGEKKRELILSEKERYVRRDREREMEWGEKERDVSAQILDWFK
jgi:hypothetical protein